MSSATTVAGFLFAHRRLRGAAGNGEQGSGRRGPDRLGRGGYPRRDDPRPRDTDPRHEHRGISGFDRTAPEPAAAEAPRAPKIYRDKLQYNREARAKMVDARARTAAPESQAPSDQHPRVLKARDDAGD